MPLRAVVAEHRIEGEHLGRLALIRPRVAHDDLPSSFIGNRHPVPVASNCTNNVDQLHDLSRVPRAANLSLSTYAVCPSLISDALRGLMRTTTFTASSFFPPLEFRLWEAFVAIPLVFYSDSPHNK
jgi:hypothetical protein